MTRAKKFLLPGATLIFSFYISTLFAAGLIIGYLGTTLFHKKLIDRGRLKLIIFGPRKWKIHLHHWVMAVLTLFLIWIGGWIHSFPDILFGMIGGIIFQDVYLDKEWYKVVLKK